MRRLFSDANYDFIGLRRRSYLGSGLLLAVCLVGALYWQFSAGSWLNYGVDFTGGTLIQVAFNEPTSVGEVRDALEASLPGSEVTRFGEETEYLVRAPATGDDAATIADLVPQLLDASFGADSYEIERVEAVGAKVGGELQTRALLAILLSFTGMLIYIAFRFEWRFGVAALIAVVHDVLVTLGLISLLQLEVALPTVAAVLTIVGYSINDTIVIFDRIRENLQAGRRVNFLDVLNRSINETLPRTVLTSGTTIATLLALFLFGGEIIRPFALILLVGILLGTYSSIFVASPALYEVEQKWPGERGRKKARPVRAKSMA